MTTLKAASDLANRPDSLPVYTSETIAGKRIQTVVGLVRGNTIRTCSLAWAIMAVYSGISPPTMDRKTARMSLPR